jgi:hypothetical protein
MGRKEIGPGKFIKWETPGQEITGEFLGIAAGQFNNKIGDLLTADGKVRFSVTKILDDRLSQVRPGDNITIEYTGRAKSQKPGQQAAKEFKVYLNDPDEQPAGEKVPF